MNPNAILVSSAILELLERLGRMTALLHKSRSEGRDVSKEELAALDVEDDAARAKLDAAIAKAKSEGR